MLRTHRVTILHIGRLLPEDNVICRRIECLVGKGLKCNPVTRPSRSRTIIRERHLGRVVRTDDVQHRLALLEATREAPAAAGLVETGPVNAHVNGTVEA